MLVKDLEWPRSTANDLSRTKIEEILRFSSPPRMTARRDWNSEQSLAAGGRWKSATSPLFEGDRIMIKKIVLGSAAIVTLGVFVFGRDVLSYAKTWGSTVREAVKAEVPLEFEVQRANELVKDLIPDIRHCMHVIAEQQVEVEDVSKQVAQREQDLSSQKEAILTLRTDLDSGESTFRYASRSFTREEVQRDVAKRFERYKIAQETLGREKQILRAREQALEANQDKLEGMLVAKKDLEVQVEQLEARLKAIQAAETVSELHVDDTQLARAKKLIRELNKQLDVKEKLLDAEGKFTGLIPVETQEEPPTDIAQQIDDYFGRGVADRSAVVSSK